MPRLQTQPNTANAASEGLREQAGGRDSEDDAEEGQQFQDAVAPGEPIVRQEFGQDAILRGREERAMAPHQEDRRELQRGPAPGQGERREQHDADLREFHVADDQRLAEAVGQPPPEHREQDERRGEQGAGQSHPSIALLHRQRTPKDEQDDQVLQRIIAEGGLELRRHQAPEATAPAGMALIAVHAVCHASWRRTANFMSIGGQVGVLSRVQRAESRAESMGGESRAGRRGIRDCRQPRRFVCSSGSARRTTPSPTPLHPLCLFRSHRFSPLYSIQHSTQHSLLFASYPFNCPIISNADSARLRIYTW
jgi:hypothetical protein